MNEPWKRCSIHGPDQPNVWGCPECLRELREENKRVVAVLIRLESAIDLHLGRSAWTQTKQLKGLAYSTAVRKELFDAHDAARDAIAQAQQ